MYLHRFLKQNILRTMINKDDDGKQSILYIFFHVSSLFLYNEDFNENLRN